MKSQPAVLNNRHSYLLSTNRGHLRLGIQTKVMGILNLTADSFSHDGCLPDNRKNILKAIALGLKKIKEGADILDIGGASSRPGSKSISANEELKRVMPVIKGLVSKTKIPLSIDTYKPQVAQQALDSGVSIINNIQGIRREKSLLKMVRDYKAAIVLMHMRASPAIMQKKIHFKNLIFEIITELRKSIENCLEIGINSDKIIIDPGIGFGKTVEHNLQILAQLSKFKILNQPILMGTSRKSFIGHILKNEVGDRLLGTAATVTASILNGAHIVRVHDVKAMKDVALVTDAIINHADKQK